MKTLQKLHSIFLAICLVVTPMPLYGAEATSAEATAKKEDVDSCKLLDSKGGCSCANYLAIEGQCISQEEYNSYLKVAAVGDSAGFSPLCQEQSLKRMQDQHDLFDDVVKTSVSEGLAIKIGKDPVQSAYAGVSFKDYVIDNSEFATGLLDREKNSVKLCKALWKGSFPASGNALGSDANASAGNVTVDPNKLLAFIDEYPSVKAYFTPEGKCGKVIGDKPSKVCLMDAEAPSIASEMAKLAKSGSGNAECNADTEHINTCRAKVMRAVFENIVPKCRAYQSVAALNNYKDPENPKGDSYSSFDGKIKCDKTSMLTADYSGHDNGCYELADAYNVMMAGEIAMDTGLQVKDTLDTFNAQNKVATASISGASDMQVASMDAAKDVAKGKSGTEAARGTGQGVKAVVLYAAAAGMRKPSTLHESCNEYNKACCQYGAYIFGNNIFPNQAARSKALMEGLKATGKSITSFFLSDAYNKQADALENAKKSLEKVSSTTDEGYTYVGIPVVSQQATLGGGETISYSGEGVVGTQIQFGGSTNSDYNFDKAANGYSRSAGTASVGTAAANKALLQALAKDASAKGGGLESIPAGATLGGGATGTNGAMAAAGGAMGGAGGGSGPGLSKDPGAAAGTEDTKKLEIGKSSLSFSGGGAKRSVAGSSNSAKADNPFASMFGGASASKTGSAINIRGPASEDVSKNDGKSIFDKISSRYEAVKKDSRLLEYTSP